MGIVKYSDNGRVYTIQGNSGNTVKPIDYALSYSCIRGYGTPQYTAGNAPTVATLSIDKTEIQIGESFTFTNYADQPCEYYMSIYDADSGELIDSGDKPQYFTNTYLRAGHYSAAMSAHNAYGTAHANWVDFWVFGDAPSYCTFSTNKTEVNLGESIILTTSTDAYYLL